jgi:hypothetical protein
MDKSLLDRGMLARLACELKYAASGMDRASWLALLSTALGNGVRETCNSKVRGLKGIGSLGLDGWHRVRRDGLAATGRALASRALDAMDSLPARVREACLRLSRLSPGELRDELVPFIIGLIVCYCASGGLDLEGGLPDADLELGIGSHRNIFSHSVLLGFTSEGVLRFAVEVLSELHGRLPVDHHPVWDKVQRLVKGSEGAAITGLWFGIGLHFVKDAGLFSHATKPYTWLPGQHGMAFHQGVFAANGAASGLMGGAQAASGNLAFD